MTLTQAPPPLAKHDFAKLATASAEVSAGQFAAAPAMWAAVSSQTPAAMAREAVRDIPLPVARAAPAAFSGGIAGSGRRAVAHRARDAAGHRRRRRHPGRRVSRLYGERGIAVPRRRGFFARLIALGFVFGLIEGLPQLLVWDRATRRYERSFLNAPIALTDRGRAALAGTYDLTTHERFNRWIGGTHLEAGTIWRWDAAREALIAE